MRERDRESAREEFIGNESTWAVDASRRRGRWDEGGGEGDYSEHQY